MATIERHPQAMAPSAAALLSGETESVESLLEELGCEFDALFHEMPENNFEARRLITRELHFEPRAEELQTIVKVAADNSAGGPRSELPRRLVLLRLLADRELRRLHDSKRLEVEPLERVSRIFPQLLAEVRSVEDRLREAVDHDASLTSGDKEYLLQVGDALACPREGLLTAALLADRLTLLARATEAGKPGSALPSLTDHEVSVIADAVRRGDDDSDHRPSRICVDAIVLRVMLEEDLEAWNRQPAWTDSDHEQQAERHALVELIKQDKVAYGVISQRLQRQQDTALLAGLEDFAEELRRIGRRLFALNLRMSPILRNPLAGPDVSSTPESTSAAEAQRELLEECLAPDAEAERSVSKDQVYLDALNRLRTPEQEQPELDRQAKEISRERRRLRVLAGIAAVLALASIAVHLLLPGKPSIPREPSARELSFNTRVPQAEAAGRMLFTRVEGWSGLDDSLRIGKVLELAEQAEQQGFSRVYVLDESDMLTAQWSSEKGVQLVQATPEP